MASIPQTVKNEAANTYSIASLVGKTIQKIKDSYTEEKLKKELLKRQRDVREATLKVEKLETANRQLETRLDKIKTTQPEPLEAWK